MLVWTLQVALCVFILVEKLSDEEQLHALKQYPSQWIVVVRFICGIVLHMMLQGEL